MRHTLPISPQFYVTAPQPCPYLVGRMERKLFTALQGEQADELNDTRKSAAGTEASESAATESGTAAKAATPTPAEDD